MLSAFRRDRGVVLARRHARDASPCRQTCVMHHLAETCFRDASFSRYGFSVMLQAKAVAKLLEESEHLGLIVQKRQQLQQQT